MDATVTDNRPIPVAYRHFAGAGTSSRIEPGSYANGNWTVRVAVRMPLIDVRDAVDVDVDVSVDATPAPLAIDDEKYEDFQKLVEAWNKATAHLSVTSQRVADRNFLKILTLGKEAIPFIFSEFERKASPAWVIALELFTDERPASDARNYREAVQRWLEWGKEHGYR